MLRRLTAMLGGGLFAVCASAAVSVVELPSPMPGQRCRTPIGSAINEGGAVIAACRVNGTDSSFLWSPQTSTWSPIAVGPTGSSTTARYLNNVGQVAGSTCYAGICQGFLWMPGQAPLLTGPGSLPSGLNDLGDMLLPSPLRVRYADGQATDLPTGWQPAFGNALNNLGEVAVNSATTSEWAMWTRSAGVVPLSLPPAGFPATTLLYGLNDTGRFVGASSGDVATQRTIFYSPVTGYQILPQYRFLYHVNALGHLAGESLIDPVNAVFSATYFRTPDETIDLGLYGGEGTTAVASNSFSQVAGFSVSGRLLVWTVSPPPPPPPEQQIASLSAALAALVNAGTISRQDATGLTSKLEACAIALSKADGSAAKNLLQATLNQLAGLEKTKRIDGASIASLRTAIESILSLLG